MSHYLAVVFGIWRWRCSAYCGQSTSTIDILNLNVVNSYSYADIVWQWLLLQSNTPKYHRPIWSPVHFNSLHYIRSASVTICYLPHTLWTTLMSALKNNVFRLFHTKYGTSRSRKLNTKHYQSTKTRVLHPPMKVLCLLPPRRPNLLPSMYLCCTYLVSSTSAAKADAPVPVSCARYDSFCFWDKIYLITITNYDCQHVLHSS